MRGKTNKVILLTAFRGEINKLIETIKINIKNLKPSDYWIIVLDNLKTDLRKLQQFSERIIFLNYSGNVGAGNARNFGLDFIIKNKFNNFLLWPLDGDDYLITGSRELVEKAFENDKIQIISFGMIKVTNKKNLNIGYKGSVNFNEVLKEYKTPCGSTILRIKNNNLLGKLRFSRRKRANDQLFFLSAIKHFNILYLRKEPIFIYNSQNKKGLSRKKWKMPIYKFLALTDLGINPFKSFFYLVIYLKVNTIDKIFSNMIVKQIQSNKKID